MTQAPLEQLAQRAVGGDREALNDLVTAVQPRVYALAVRMLWNRQDAEDATQEILVRVVTRLAQFDFRSRLTTRVYRVAVNYLLDVKKSPVERIRLTSLAKCSSGSDEDSPAHAVTDQNRHLLWPRVIGARAIRAGQRISQGWTAARRNEAK